MKLTNREKQVLKAIVNNVVSDQVNYLLDDNYSWVNIQEIQEETELEINVIKGVLSSLLQKDILMWGDENEMCLAYSFLEEMQEKGINSLLQLCE